MADRRAQLLRGVIADPDSVAARQVYADELMQAGDPRGELIQLELALAGPLGIRTREQLAQRHLELVAAHARAWFPYKITSYRTRGGFLASVRATFGQLRAAAAMFAAEPIVEVEVTELDAASAKQLATAPWLARLRRLILRSPIGDAAFAALWRSRGAAHLRALNVTAGGLGAAALAGAGDGMPQLETLVLSANPIGDAGLAALGAWRHLGGLETLYLSGCRITPAGLDALLAGGGLARLDKLCLSKNPLGDAIGAVIAGHAARLPALRHLELAGTGATASAVATIVAARLPKLAILDVRNNNLARQGVAGLAPYVRA